MAYEVYLDDVLLPVPPQKIQIKTPGQNKTANLINGDEINIIKKPGLTELSLDIVLPQFCYPFAMYEDGFQEAEYFLDKFEELKNSGSAFPFIVIRDGPGRHSFHDTNIDVTLEDYKVTDDVKEGCDVSVSLNLKEYRYYGTKKLNISINPGQEEAQASSQEMRQTETAPQAASYTVVAGDCLWTIAKRLMGNGSRWQEIYNLNKDKISNPNLIYPGQVLTIP